MLRQIDRVSSLLVATALTVRIATVSVGALLNLLVRRVRDGWRPAAAPRTVLSMDDGLLGVGFGRTRRRHRIGSRFGHDLRWKRSALSRAGMRRVSRVAGGISSTGTFSLLRPGRRLLFRPPRSALLRLPQRFRVGAALVAVPVLHHRRLWGGRRHVLMCLGCLRPPFGLDAILDEVVDPWDERWRGDDEVAGGAGKRADGGRERDYRAWVSALCGRGFIVRCLGS